MPLEIQLLLALLLGIAIGAASLYAVMKSKGSAETAVLEERLKNMDQSFEALSSKVLKSNNQAFLDLAQESFKNFHLQAKNDLDKRQISISETLKPLKESLSKVDSQYTNLEKSLSGQKSSLEAQLKELASQNQKLQSETHTLSMALKNPKVRGQWGEMGLRRVAELAGMVEHCDFEEQVARRDDEVLKIPDMVIHLPNKEQIVVDAKTPLKSYMDSLEAKTEEEKQQALKNHAQNLKKHVQELSQKSYWDQFEYSPSFVVLYLPGDHLYNAALEKTPGIVDEAMAQGVIIATPSTLLALLKSASFGWRQETLAESAEEIRDLGKELYDRLATFISHLKSLETNLGRSVKSYNDAVGSLETRILPSARKFEALGIQGKKEIETVKPVETALRELRQNDSEEKDGDS
jgi:DNA recombination protein RmuC